MKALSFIRRFYPIIVLLIFENVLNLEKKMFYHVLFFIFNFFTCMTCWLKNTSLDIVYYSSLFMLYDLLDEMWDVGNVVC